MNARRWAAGALGLGLCCLLAGCRPPATQGPSVGARDWEGIAACLPGGLTLETEFCPNRPGCDPGERTTVKRDLAELGARARGGKLYDPSGKEIALYRLEDRSNGIGTLPPPEEEQRELRELQQLQRTHTVVLMYTGHGPVP
jgi:hypothetical protein